MVGVAERTRNAGSAGDGEDGRGDAHSARNTLSRVSGNRWWRWRHVRSLQCDPHQIVHAWQTEANTWRQSRRLPRAEDGTVLAHAVGRRRAQGQARADEVTAPRTLFSWDITYVQAPLGGDTIICIIYGCVLPQGVGAEIHAEESMEHSSQVLETICVKKASSRIRCLCMRTTEER